MLHQSPINSWEIPRLLGVAQRFARPKVVLGSTLRIVSPRNGNPRLSRGPNLGIRVYNFRHGAPEAGSGYKWDQIIRVQTGIWRTDLWGDMQGSSSGVYPACCEDAPVPRRAKARRTDAPAAGLPGKVADTRIHHHHVMCDCHGHNANILRFRTRKLKSCGKPFESIDLSW